MPPRKPRSATLVCYRVGFGDCFLLELEYPHAKKHLLIDFGTRKGLEGGPKRAEVANDIARRCDGHLDAIVVTHRHGDHINGFITKPDGTGTGDTIARLSPKLIVQPWTEHPDAARNAKKPPDSLALSLQSIAFADALHTLDAMASTASDEVQRLLASDAPGVAKLLPYIGQDTVKERSAVENLMNMGRNAYVFAGSETGLEQLFPGLSFTVLGPPTIEQYAAIRTQRSRDPLEFWQLAAETMSADAVTPLLFAGANTVEEARWSPAVRWFVRRLQEQRLDQLYEIVTALDSAMNNTSVNLLIRVGRHKLLFPGDAQIEAWEYALGNEELSNALEDVTLYKVGHHGSRNATPKSLWNRLERRNTRARSDRLITVLSTASDFHGHAENHTEVPRTSLVGALAQESELHDLRAAGDSLADEIRLEL